METTGIVFQQTLTMAIYMLVGFALFKGGKITKEGSKSLANLLVVLSYKRAWISNRTPGPTKSP